MKTTLYWFSGTGNSLAVAKMLAEKLPDTELIPIAEAIRHLSPRSVEGHGEPAGRIGIICPVYAFGPPDIVERFIQKLNAAPDAFIFAVFTCACTAGGSVYFLQKRLGRRGLNLSAAWIVKMPENYPPLGGTPGPRSQQKTHAAAEQKTGRIAAQLQSGAPEVKERAALFGRIAARFIYPAFRGFERHGADRFFRADSKCNGCGLCAKVCPVDNIRMKDGVPDWQGHCEQCFACFHWCPQQAVQYGLSSRLRRYHHPRTSVSDFSR